MESAFVVSMLLQWVLLLVLGLLVLALVRQVGVLHQRLGPAGALMIGNGTGLGEQSPEIPVRTLDGDDLLIGASNPHARSTLLMFVSPDCPVCKQLVPAVRALARSERSWLNLVFVGDGNEAEYAAMRSRMKIESYPMALSPELGMQFQVGKLPYGVLLDERGVLVSQGLTNNREHIESLLEAKRRGVATLQDYVSVQASAVTGPASVSNL